MSVIVRHKNIPEISELKNRLYILAVFNIIMLDEDNAWLRIHSKLTDPDGQLSIFQIYNGAGDEMFVIFSNDGCIIKGFDHESFFSPYARDEFHVWDGIYDEVPQKLLRQLDDPMFEKDDVTFCIWSETDDSEWHKGSIENSDNDDDGFDFLIDYLYSSPEDLCKWAQNYFEKAFSQATIKQIYSGVSVDEKIIKEINPERDAQLALKEIAVL